MRVAVIGSGISGLVAARELAPHHEIDVFEASGRLGGHTHTVEVAREDVCSALLGARLQAKEKWEGRRRCGSK